MPRITLLTDFGTRDGYAGALKGVLSAGCPGAIIDDISHDIAQGDLVGAAYALGYYCDLYPEGSIHLVIVDPGVGSERRAIAARSRNRFLIGPDNGVLSQALAADAEIRQLPIPEGAARTFHGRDVFAPVVARLANGLSFRHIGARVLDPVQLALPACTRDRAEVIYIDHFGNLITNVTEPPMQVRLAGHLLELTRTYAEVEAGQPLALMNSRGVLEIAVRDGSAAAFFQVGRGAPLELIY